MRIFGQSIISTLEIRRCGTERDKGRLSFPMHSEDGDFFSVNYLHMKERVGGTQGRPARQLHGHQCRLWTAQTLNWLLVLAWLHNADNNVRREAVSAATAAQKEQGSISRFPIHTEDGDLFSVNYLHAGAPKIWYGMWQKDNLKVSYSYGRQRLILNKLSPFWSTKSFSVKSFCFPVCFSCFPVNLTASL